MDLQLAGKVAFVTGSTGGIGEATAMQLGREGASVVVHGRREAEARRVVAAIEGEGGTAEIALGDLSNDEGAAQATRAALGAFGHVDILVNNAAAFVNDDWDRIDPAVWLDQYNRNVGSIVRVVKDLLPQMRARKWGRLIQLSSTGADMPSNMTVAYGGTKAAISSFSVGMAKVLAGSGITVNTVSPGPVLTSMLAGWIERVARERDWQGDLMDWERRFVAELRPNPCGRMGRVEELADAITFLASPRAGFINGANLRVDGGVNPTI